MQYRLDIIVSSYIFCICNSYIVQYAVLICNSKVTWLRTLCKSVMDGDLLM